MNNLRNSKNRMLCFSFKNTYTETVSRPTGSWKLEAGWWLASISWTNFSYNSHTFPIQISY